MVVVEDFLERGREEGFYVVILFAKLFSIWEGIGICDRRFNIYLVKVFKYSVYSLVGIWIF